jgi:hypothetical protein
MNKKGTKFKAKDTTTMNKKSKVEVEEENEEVFEACIFNCTYVQQQLDDEEATQKGRNSYSDGTMDITKNGVQNMDVIVTDTISDDGTMSLDDKSLLDYDSSNSWEDEKR